MVQKTSRIPICFCEYGRGKEESTLKRNLQLFDSKEEREKKNRGRSEETKKKNILMRGWMSHFDDLQSLPLSAFHSLNVLPKREFIRGTVAFSNLFLASGDESGRALRRCFM